MCLELFFFKIKVKEVILICMEYLSEVSTDGKSTGVMPVTGELRETIAISLT